MVNRSKRIAGPDRIRQLPSVIETLQRIKEISPHAEPILVISLTAILGLLLGSIRIGGMKLGVAGMLFSGLLLGHFGFTLDPHLMAFLKEFGLVLFVFTVGLQLGPGFFNSLKNEGLKLNSIAVAVVLSGAGIAFGMGHFLNWDLGVMAGTLSGATTNTPSLGAAQQAMATSQTVPGRRISPRWPTPSPIRSACSASSSRWWSSALSSASIRKRNSSFSNRKWRKA